MCVTPADGGSSDFCLQEEREWTWEARRKGCRATPGLCWKKGLSCVVPTPPRANVPSRIIFWLFIPFYWWFLKITSLRRSLKYIGLAQNYRALMSHVPSLLWLWVALLWNILLWNIFMSYNLQDPCPFHFNSHGKKG